MKYIIMFLIVLGLAFADFVTGYIKAKCADKVSSKALSVFAYIVIMELISILENFAAIVPQARWARKILKRLKNYEGKEE